MNTFKGHDVDFQRFTPLKRIVSFPKEKNFQYSQITGPQRCNLARTPFQNLRVTQRAQSHSSSILIDTDNTEKSKGNALRKWIPLAVCIMGLFLISDSALAASSPNQQNFLKQALDVILHLDHHLAQIIGKYGKATYAILWSIVFCETGLVLTPFLPGDSLLFACGALASLGSLNLGALFLIFISAAILGDSVNYQIGKFFGAKAKTSRLVKQEYLEKTEEFYERYGGKTVVLARFIPIVRTFAPFVAGVGVMSYKDFSFYNIVGALSWTVIFVGGGALLGNVPAVKHNFSIVVFAIIGVSLLPVAFEVFQARRHRGRDGTQSGDAI